MTQIQPFTFPLTGEAVRTLLVDDATWFVMPDVCAVLGHSNPSMALALVDEDDRWALRRSDALSFAYPFDDLRIQSVNLVNESGLYSLILRSNVAGAREFKRWVTHDVLPAIRQTGSYSLPREYSRLELIDMARESELARIDAENRAAQAECQMLELAPAARAWDELSEAAGDYSVREAAQILGRDPAIQTGQRRLFEYLRAIGWLDRHNQPYQAQISRARLGVRARTYEHPRRDEQVATQQVRITPKGLGELHKRLGGIAQVGALLSEGVSA